VLIAEGAVQVHMPAAKATTKTIVRDERNQITAVVEE
jgi:hypothetical protein